MDFHAWFEEIIGSDCVGKLLLFKECLRHDITPFIINTKRRYRYLHSIKEWHDDWYELIDVVMEAQDCSEAQVELQKLRAVVQLYLPADFFED